MIFAQSEREITLIYNSTSHVGRVVNAYAESSGLPVHAIDTSKTHVSLSQWAELASRLKIPVQDLLNTDSLEFHNKFSEPESLNEHDWLRLLEKNPEFLKAPIVMKGNQIEMIENPQEMLRFS